MNWFHEVEHTKWTDYPSQKWMPFLSEEKMSLFQVYKFFKERLLFNHYSSVYYFTTKTQSSKTA